MSWAEPPLFLALLREPATAAALPARAWRELLPQFHQARLAGWFAAHALGSAWEAALPPAVARQARAAEVLVRAQQRSVRWELGELRRALAATGVPLVALKGAGYVAAGLAPAQGREMADVDILVPRGRLPAVRAAVEASGWRTADPDPENRAYFEAWSHQVPTCEHAVRRTLLDIHHTLIAPTGRFPTDAEALLAGAVEVPGTGIHVLGPADQVLAAAAHFVRNKEFPAAIRDLLDAHLLAGTLGREAGFWDAVLARAGVVGVRRPLWFLLAAAADLLGTEVPPVAWAVIDGWGPPAPARRLLRRWWRRALVPDGLGEPSPAVRRARQALYLLGLRAGLPVRVMVARTVRRRWRERRGEGAPGEP